VKCIVSLTVGLSVKWNTSAESENSQLSFSVHVLTWPLIGYWRSLKTVIIQHDDRFRPRPKFREQSLLTESQCIYNSVVWYGRAVTAKVCDRSLHLAQLVGSNSQWLLSPQIWNQNRAQLPEVLGGGSPQISDSCFPPPFWASFPSREKILLRV